MIESNLSFSKEAKQGHMSAALYYKEKSGQEKITKDSTAFSGYSLRKEHVEKSKKVHFTTSLNCDFLNCPRLLPPGCNLRFVFTKQNDDFLILNEDAKKYTVKIHDLSIEYRSVEVAKETFDRHENRFKTMNAIFPYHKVKLTHFTIPQNVQEYTIENLITGTLPQQIYVAFVLDESFSGKPSKNPYVFEHFDLNSFVFKINGDN